MSPRVPFKKFAIAGFSHSGGVSKLAIKDEKEEITLYLDSIPDEIPENGSEIVVFYAKKGVIDSVVPKNFYANVIED